MSTNTVSRDRRRFLVPCAEAQILTVSKLDSPIRKPYLCKNSSVITALLL